MSIHEIIHLSDHFNKDDLSKLKKELPDFDGNGIALLIGHASSLIANKELMSMGNKSIGATIKNMAVRHQYTPENDICVDDASRNFFIKHTALNEYILNCSSFNQEQFTGLEDFDKYEIKERLLRLADTL